jgi:hypothetical protein
METTLTPWTLEEARKERNMAMGALRHDCNGSRDPDMRSNCGACCLLGYHPRGEDRTCPNYAGWLRVYIQLKMPVLFKAARAEMEDQTTRENQRYMDAIQRDVLTWGCPVKGHDGKNLCPVCGGTRRTKGSLQ